MVFTNDSGNYLLKCLASVVACTSNCPTNILTTMSTMTKSLLYYKLQANNNNGRGMTPDLCYCDLWPVTMTAFFWRSTCRFCTDIQIFKLLQKHLMTNSVSNHREAYLRTFYLQNCRDALFHIIRARLFMELPVSSPPPTDGELTLWKRFAVGEFNVNVQCVSCNRDSFSLTEVYLENNRSERASWTLGMLPLNDISIVPNQSTFWSLNGIHSRSLHCK